MKNICLILFLLAPSVIAKTESPQQVFNDTLVEVRFNAERAVTFVGKKSANGLHQSVGGMMYPATNRNLKGRLMD